MDDQRHQTLLQLGLQSFFDNPAQAEAVILLVVVYQRNHEPKQLCVLALKGGEDLGDCVDAEFDEVEGVFGLEAREQVDFVLGQG